MRDELLGDKGAKDWHCCQITADMATKGVVNDTQTIRSKSEYLCGQPSSEKVVSFQTG